MNDLNANELVSDCGFFFFEGLVGGCGGYIYIFKLDLVVFLVLIFAVVSSNLCDFGFGRYTGKGKGILWMVGVYSCKVDE